MDIDNSKNNDILILQYQIEKQNFNRFLEDFYQQTDHIVKFIMKIDSISTKRIVIDTKTGLVNVERYEKYEKMITELNCLIEYIRQSLMKSYGIR